MNEINPIISFLSYQAASINKYDEELIKICQSLGLDFAKILAIFFAQKRNDVIHILEKSNIHETGTLMRILQLKKLSAAYKFYEAYGLKTEQDIENLREKSKIYFQ